MSIVIDIVIFGKTLLSEVELLERNVALVAMYFGLFLKWLINNINMKEEDFPIPDIFFGKGFSSLFKGDLSYLSNPLKELFKLKGPLFGFLVVTLVGLAFPSFIISL